MPGRRRIPPLLSPIPESVWLRYFSINQSNINSRTAEKMPRHTHGPAAGALRGIPISDWMEGHFEWHREGCDCVVKLCPQHCRELIGSNNDESEDRSIRVDRSDPYDGLGSNDEGPEASGRNDVDDDYNGEEDHDDDDPNDHIPSVLPSVEGGNPSGSPEETAQNDPEATVSPENSDGLESGEIPQPQLPHVQRPEQQPPPPALTLNADYLEAVSPGLRAELVAYVEAISEYLRAYILPQAPASTVSAPDPPSRLLAVYQPSGRLAREIRHLIREGQALRPLSDSTTPPPGPGGHLERSPPDILAHVLNVSPSPKVGPSGSGSAPQAVRGGGGGEDNVGSATSRTPAQPQPAGPSQLMPVPPMGIFFTSVPKPVARRLFGRSDPSQRQRQPPPQRLQQLPQLEPRQTSSTPANTTTTTTRRAPPDPQPPNARQALSEPAPAPAPHAAAPRPPNMSSPQQLRPRSSTSAHKKTPAASRASSRSTNEQDEQEDEQEDEQDEQEDEQEDEEQEDIQGEASGSSNVDSRQLEEEESSEQSSEQDELAGQSEEQEVPTSSSSRPKRTRPKKSGSTVTYGKRGNKRRRV